VLGVRPFYYHAAPHIFLFASDIDAVLAHPVVPDELDVAYLAANLRIKGSFFDQERTFFAGVHKLPPAHLLIVDEKGVRHRPYWQPEAAPPVRLPTDEAYIAQLRELFTEAISCRTRAAYPVAAHFSGGLDSSSIAVVAARALREDGRQLARGFSWAQTPAEGESFPAEDTRARMISLAAAEGFAPGFTDIQAREVARIVLNRERFLLIDYPHESHICGQAEKAGIRLILSGWGGDQLLTLHPGNIFVDTFRRRQWRRTYRELKVRAEQQGSSLWNVALGNLLLPLIPDPFFLRLRPRGKRAQRFRQSQRVPELPHLFQPSFRALLAGAEQLRGERIDPQFPLRRYQLAKIRSGQMTNRIEGWQAMGARFGLQYAFPMLDRRVVEFALGLPPEMYVRDGVNRWLFRRTIAGILPDEMRWMNSKRDPTMGDTNIVYRTIMRDQVIPLMQTVLLDWIAGGKRFHCLDPVLVRSVIVAHQNDPPAKPVPEEMRVLISALQVEQWLNPELAAEIQERIEGLESG
jgi:asparagine synthase (glutamine-hydrolysing)